MDGPWGHYAEWDKSDRERQMLYDHIYTENLKKAKRMEKETRMVVGAWGREN